MTVITFDTHSAIKRLMQTGVQEKQAEEFVKIFSEIKDTNLDRVASKEQVIALEKDVENIIQQVATKVDLEKVRTELKTDLEKVRTEVQQVRTEVQQVRTEMHQAEKRLLLMMGAAVVAICTFTVGAMKYLLHLT